jgi:hypothetical protein
VNCDGSSGAGLQFLCCSKPRQFLNTVPANRTNKLAQACSHDDYLAFAKGIHKGSDFSNGLRDFSLAEDELPFGS